MGIVVYQALSEHWITVQSSKLSSSFGKVQPFKVLKVLGDNLLSTQRRLSINSGLASLSKLVMLSEFRKDLVSGEWVLFSTGRSHSIRQFKDSYQPKEGCPFEDLQQSGHQVIWRYPDNDLWDISVIQNKFPAVKPGLCTNIVEVDHFSTHEAMGEHDLFIFRNHDFHLADLSVEQVVSIVRAYKIRFREISKSDPCAKYIMLFHNFGLEAGASIYHPHSQIISLPILPPDVSRSLYGARRFYEEHGKRVYDVLIQWEMDKKIRIVHENERFVAFCPFVSKTPYEIRIFPKESHAHFDLMPDDENDVLFSQILSVVCKKVKKALDNPPFNFFVHTAPLESSLGNLHEFYTWHIEILPKSQTMAGFEMGAGIEINVVDPDGAAKLLRETQID